MLSSSRNTTATTAAGISLEKSLHARSSVCVSSISIDICPNPCERLIDVKFVVTEFAIRRKDLQWKIHDRGERERERQVEIRDAFTNCVVSLEVEAYIRMQPCDQRLLNTRVDDAMRTRINHR